MLKLQMCELEDVYQERRDSKQFLQPETRCLFLVSARKVPVTGAPEWCSDSRSRPQSGPLNPDIPVNRCHLITESGLEAFVQRNHLSVTAPRPSPFRFFQHSQSILCAFMDFICLHESISKYKWLVISRCIRVECSKDEAPVIAVVQQNISLDSANLAIASQF